MVTADEGSTEEVIIKLNGSYTPRTFRLDGERPRLVFDFIEVRYLFDKTSIEGAGGDIIAGVRVGRHRNPLKTRVVVDIVKGSQYEYEQTFNVSNNSLVLNFFPGSSESQNGPVQRHIQLGKAKIIHETEPIEDKQEISQEQAEPEKTVEEGDTVSQPEDAAHAMVLPADEEKQEVAVDDASAAVPTADEEKQEATVDDASTEQQTTIAVPDEKDEEPVAVVEKDDGEKPAEDMQPADSAHPFILDVSFEQSINNSETVLFKLSHFYPPLVFGIEKGEPRVVCDFHDAEVMADVPSEIETGGKYVNRITVATLKDPDKVRVELELVPNHHYDLQQLFFKEDNLFVVIVNELKENDTTAN